MDPAHGIRKLAAPILLVACGFFLTGCFSLEISDVGRLAEDAANDVRREGSELLPGEDTSAQGESRTVTVERAVDGDTFEISPAIDGKTDVRLIGVDSPELDSSQPLAQEAADFTANALEGERVRLTPGRDPVDPYDRLLATVKPQGQQRTHGAILLERGYAQTLWYKPNTGYRPLYEQTQEYARQSQAGIWGLALEQRCQLANNANGIGENSPECGGS